MTEAPGSNLHYLMWKREELHLPRAYNFLDSVLDTLYHYYTYISQPVWLGQYYFIGGFKGEKKRFGIIK